MPDVSFEHVLNEEGLPQPEKEFRFHPVRRWRFDWAWPDQKVALEVEGGVWTRGRHTRPSGFIKDMEKYNEATRLGWHVVRCVPDELCSPETINLLTDLFGRHE